MKKNSVPKVDTSAGADGGPGDAGWSKTGTLRSALKKTLRIRKESKDEPVAEVTSQQMDTTSRLSQVDDSQELKAGQLLMREEGKNKFQRYHAVLTTVDLLFYRNKNTRQIEDTQPEERFGLLKMMLKEAEGDTAVRFLCSGKWYEFKAEAVSGETTAAQELQKWSSAIRAQRDALYAGRKEALDSSRKVSIVAEGATERGLLEDARNNFLKQSQKGRVQGTTMAFHNVEKQVNDARVQTALKKLDLLALHYHKVDLECIVVQGHLSEMKTIEAGIAKRLLSLVDKRTTLQQQLEQLWSEQVRYHTREETLIKQLGRDLETLSAAIVSLHSGSLKIAMDQLVQRKAALDESTVDDINAAANRLKGVVELFSPLLSFEKVLQQHAYELQATVESLERNNKQMEEQLQAEQALVQQHTGRVDLDKGADFIAGTLSMVQGLAAMPPKMLADWLNCGAPPTTPTARSATPPSNANAAAVMPATLSPGQAPLVAHRIMRPRASSASEVDWVDSADESDAAKSDGPTMRGSKVIELQERELVIGHLRKNSSSNLLADQASAQPLKEKVLQPATRDSIRSMEAIVVAPMATNAKFDATLRETRAQAQDVEARVAALRTRIQTLSDRSISLLRQPSFDPSTAAVAAAAAAGSQSADVEYEKLEGFGGRARILSASRDKLIELMTTDADSRKTVLYTFKLFVSPAGLLGRLMLIYTNVPAFESEKMYLKVHALMEPLRQGVVESVALWSKMHPADFQLDSVRVLLRNFIQLLRDTGVSDKAIEVFRRVEKGEHVDAAVGDLLPSLPVAAALTSSSSVTIHNAPAEEVARQLTLLDYEAYHLLEAVELHRIAKGFADAPHVRDMTRVFNRVSAFVVSLIVSEADLNERAATISWVIRLAQHLVALNNWNGVMIVVSAMANTSVTRLSETWKAVAADDAHYYRETLEPLTRKNFKQLRQLMSNSKSPSIPHLAIFVRDLTAIDESPTLLQNGHVNFSKMRTVAEIYYQLLRHRRVHFPFAPLRVVQVWLMQSTILTENQCYERSKQLQPQGGAPPSATSTGAATSTQHPSPRKASIWK